MRRLTRVIALTTCFGLAGMLLAPPAEAKLLPYDLYLDSPRAGPVHQPVAVVMQLDPQNVFPATIEFEIHWLKLRRYQVARKAARRSTGNAIVMHQIGPKEYRGTFTPTTAGRYVVYGRTAVFQPPRSGYPKPIIVHVFA
jgi:hypothetical protein